MVDAETPTRVERKREVRTAAILDAAMRLVTAEGLDALTLARLAQALDYVPAALYRYFPSKDALLAALQRRAIADIHVALAASREHGPGLARILAAARIYLDLPRTHPEAHFLVSALVGDPRVLLSDDESRQTAPLLLGLLADVDEAIREAAAAGALARGESFERTLGLWAVLQGALSLEKARRVAPGLPTARAVGESAVRAMLVGWGASPAAVARAARQLDGTKKSKGRS